MGKPYAIGAIITMVIGSGYILLTSNLFHHPMRSSALVEQPAPTTDTETTNAKPVPPVTVNAATGKSVTHTNTHMYENKKFGFTLSYGGVEGAVTEHERVGFVHSETDPNGGVTEAPHEPKYTEYNYQVGDRSLFVVTGKDFMSHSDGFAFAQFYATCVTGIDSDTKAPPTAYSCTTKTNSKGTRYYEIDKLDTMAGLVDMVLVPLANDMILSVVQIRTDSLEQPATPAEVATFHALVDTIVVK
jgi:hypothetical protein